MFDAVAVGVGAGKSLHDIFGSVVVLSLDAKECRRERLRKNLVETGVADPERVTWRRAFCGDLLRPPLWWRGGAGAWGCLQSHARAIEDAAHAGEESVVIIEDDALFAPRARLMLERLMDEVPGGWGQVYLGGQHRGGVRPVRRGGYVERPEAVNRTHCYAVHHSAYAAVHRHIWHMPDYQTRERGWHIDHQLEVAHKRQFRGDRQDWDVFSPSWWLCGQAAGSSNINGRQEPERWWHRTTGARALPVVWMPEDFEPGAELLAALHPGRNLLEGTCEDEAVAGCVGHAGRLAKHLDLVAREACGDWKLPAVQGEGLGIEEVRVAWGAEVVDVERLDLKAAMGWPFDATFAHALNGVGEGT